MAGARKRRHSGSSTEAFRPDEAMHLIEEAPPTRRLTLLKQFLMADDVADSGQEALLSRAVRVDAPSFGVGGKDDLRVAALVACKVVPANDATIPPTLASRLVRAMRAMRTHSAKVTQSNASATVCLPSDLRAGTSPIPYVGGSSRPTRIYYSGNAPEIAAGKFLQFRLLVEGHETTFAELIVAKDSDTLKTLVELGVSSSTLDQTAEAGRFLVDGYYGPVDDIIPTLLFPVGDDEYVALTPITRLQSVNELRRVQDHAPPRRKCLVERFAVGGSNPQNCGTAIGDFRGGTTSLSAKPHPYRLQGLFRVAARIGARRPRSFIVPGRYYDAEGRLRQENGFPKSLTALCPPQMTNEKRRAFVRNAVSKMLDAAWSDIREVIVEHDVEEYVENGHRLLPAVDGLLSRDDAIEYDYFDRLIMRKGMRGWPGLEAFALHVRERLLNASAHEESDLVVKETLATIQEFLVKEDGHVHRG